MLEQKVYQYKKDNDLYRKDNTKLAIVVKKQEGQIGGLNDSLEDQSKQYDNRIKYMNIQNEKLKIELQKYSELT